MNYELKDKIIATKELLSELEVKSWQEIEHLQTQIANLADSPINDKLKQLLKNLLTSYYIFTGGVETLSSESADLEIEPIKAPIINRELAEPIEAAVEQEMPAPADELQIEDTRLAGYEADDTFEYFVDFDDPIGDPITDDDLYN